MREEEEALARRARPTYRATLRAGSADAHALKRDGALAAAAVQNTRGKDGAGRTFTDKPVEHDGAAGKVKRVALPDVSIGFCARRRHPPDVVARSGSVVVARARVRIRIHGYDAHG